MQVIETKIRKSEIYNFDECFLTSTISEIVPVVSTDNNKIGDCVPGNYTKILMKVFRKEVDNYCKHIA